VFDPGQGMPLFSGEELLRCLKLARYCTVNDYEARLLCDKTGRSLGQLADEVEALVVTLGPEGSHIYAEGRRFEIPCAEPTSLVDPTGCGDAYRAGLLYGILEGYEWSRAGRLASLMGALKIESRGGQNHAPGRDAIAARYEAAFGECIW
jgi:adenosine kinase